MSFYAPIVVFTYRRVPDKLIDSLLNNSLSKESELFIFSDGNKNEVDKKDILEVREYIKNISGFKNITIYESRTNKGLANSIIEGVTKIINKYEKIIVLEDDLIVAENFLDYMNEALEFYKEDQRIWAISGYTPTLPSLENYDKDIYLSVRANSWGWATWQDRWNSIDWDIKDWKEFRKDKTAIAEFNRGGNDMFKMLELQMLGKIDSWAIRWCYSQFKHKAYTIYPTKSKIINFGFDAKGTHNNSSADRWQTKLSNQPVVFEPIEPDEQLLRDFTLFYNLALKTRIGYFLKKYGGYYFVKKLINRFIK